MKTEITAIILAGGSSSRMGENKALLNIGGKTVLEIILEKLKMVFKNLLLITNNQDEFNKFGIKIYEDIFPGYGPLSGIHSGLTYSSTKINFFISCDLPLISIEAIKYIIEYKTQKPIVLYRHKNYVEKLCGIYTKDCLKEAEKLLSESSKIVDTGKQNVSMSSLISACEKEIIEFEKLPFYSNNTFLNMNTKEDYSKITKIMTQK